MRYVVVATPTALGRRTAAWPSSPLAAGDVVAAGAVVGTTDGRLHFGLRVGDAYVDPAPLLGRLVDRPRLVPTDGTPPRAGPAAACLACVGGVERGDRGDRAR